MNNSGLLFLIRRDATRGLAAHLAAGILALVLLTGAARTSSRTVAHTATASSVVAHR